MQHEILVTGSEGLIGRAIVERLRAAGHYVRPFDIRSSVFEDTRNTESLFQAMDGVDGIVHLAAVSRVVWGEQNPELTWDVNVTALENLTARALSMPNKPWIVFASSREVYGQSDTLPVKESAPHQPMNTYARSKVAGEQIANAASKKGLVANICRFSNVYGCPMDHEDRVSMAFARVAALGGEMRVDGSNNIFDFTHVNDVADGLFKLVEATRTEGQLPPVHFVTGRPVTLGELAQLAASTSRHQVTLRESPPRSFDVHAFVGDPTATERLIGWRASTPLEAGFADLVDKIATNNASLAAADWRALLATA